MWTILARKGRIEGVFKRAWEKEVGEKREGRA